MESDVSKIVLLGGLFIYLIISLVIGGVIIASQWVIFTKAGKPGWASLIPIYNIVILLEIVGKPTWWLVLMFIPFVNIAVSIIILHNLSLSFGKDSGFTIGLVLLSVIFFPILAFGEAKYIGPAGGEGSTY
ncbi:DUF5684 domain-containing protein [Eisenibacter elegans]|uniref:DUF5684 domain-containing protein n=1 Tax=Eisenibacter elegans TaxID=997 RepID=UPI00042613BC|nr:DUF5684 domain-containing protein [Eisenibacter elegans]